MHSMKLGWRALAVALLGALCLQGCSVVSVADAAVSTVATGVKITTKVVGAAVDAVLPDKEEPRK